ERCTSALEPVPAAGAARARKLDVDLDLRHALVHAALADAKRARVDAAERGIHLPDPEVVAREVHHEERVAAAVGVDRLVDEPAEAGAGEVVLELPVEPGGDGAGRGVDLDAVARVLAEALTRGQVVRRSGRVRRDER